MNKEEMLYELKKGNKPIEVAIAKWTDIVYNKGIDDGIYNCALCHENESCSLCPLKDCLDDEAPYRKWYAHHLKQHAQDEELEIICDTCLLLAQEMLNKLIELNKSERIYGSITLKNY